MRYVEILFLVDMFVRFITSIDNPTDPNFLEPIRDISKTSSAYLRGNFLEHLIPLVPLQLLKLTRNRANLLYILKIVRIKRGIENL